MKSKI
jgi:hypothetical protein